MQTPFNKPSNATGGKIGAVRDKLLFTDEYWHGPSKTTLRLYRTRGGTYGPQWQGVLWQGDNPESPWLGRRTTGCGYSKVNAAVASVLAMATDRRIDEDHSPERQLAALLGVDPYDIHHAHG